MVQFVAPGCVKPLAIVICSALSASCGENAAVDYIRDIRPILSNNCFKCHGPDEETRQAELRLDTPEGALADRGGYRAIDREEPAASELLLRINSADDAERMPPPESGLTLSSDQIGALAKVDRARRSDRTALGPATDTTTRGANRRFVVAA